MWVFRCVFYTWAPFFMMRGRQRRERLSPDAGERVGAIHNGMSLSISCVMKKDWEGLHGPTATQDRAIAMHRLLPLRLSKWRPAACEVRLWKKEEEKRQAEHKVKRFSLLLFIPSMTGFIHNSSSPSKTETGVSNANLQTLRRTNRKYRRKQTK